MNEIQTINTKALFAKFVAELDRAVATNNIGGLINLRARAEEMGLQVGSLKMLVEAKGFAVKNHGKYGMCATFEDSTN